jgi:hypothetical protein
MRGVAAWTAIFAMVAGCGGGDRRTFDDTSKGGPTGGGGPTPDPGGAPGLGAPPGGTGACVSTSAPNKATDITVDPAFAAKYTAYDLGQVPGMPAYKYGGLVLLAGDENTLLLGGFANDPGARIYAVKLVRNNCKHIVGFAGPAVEYAYAPHIDGGLVYGPNGTLMFAGWPANTLGILRAGEKNPARTLDAATLGIPEALAAIGFVPKGFPGDGRFKLVAWEGGQFYDATVTVGNDGLPEVKGVTQVLTLPGGPEGFAYVPQGSPLFAAPTMIVSEWSANRVAVYDVAATGDPTLATRKTFLTGLSGAEGAYFDPPTGDFLFSTWNTRRPERMILVTGFAPVAPPK